MKKKSQTLNPSIICLNTIKYCINTISSFISTGMVVFPEYYIVHLFEDDL